MINGRKRRSVYRLSITADDYGPHPFINRGILEGVRKNRVSSVNVLTNRYKNLNGSDVPYHYDLEAEIDRLIEASEAPSRNKEILPHVGIGVHLTISSGAPLTHDPELIHRKNIEHFQDARAFMFSARPEHLRAMKEEIKAQINTLRNVLKPRGMAVDHVSSHQGLISLYDPYHHCLVEALNEIYNAEDAKDEKRPVIRTPYPIGKLRRYKRMFKSRMVREGARRALTMVDDNFKIIAPLILGTTTKQLNVRIREFRDGRYFVPDYFFDTFYKQPSHAIINTVLRKFPNWYTVNRGEFVVHLGRAEGMDYEENVRLHGINANYFPIRQRELDILLKFPLYAVAKRRNVSIMSMGDLHNADI